MRWTSRAASLALAIVALGGSAARAEESAKPVEVLVLGTWHFNNPGRDLVNTKAEDVLTPKRQAEIADLSVRLARFRPTVVAVEAESTRPDLSLPAYQAFTPADLRSKRNETVQVGYRLARSLGLKQVHGVDEQGGPGEPDYFPYDKVQAFAAGGGETARLQATIDHFKAEAKRFEAEQSRRTMVELLRAYNDPVKDARDHSIGYYGVLRVGDAKDQPGAELNALWYMRNAKIFAKLAEVTKPGDRVVLIFGAGHSYWLRHFAASTPGFTLVPAADYLR